MEGEGGVNLLLMMMMLISLMMLVVMYLCVSAQFVSHINIPITLQTSHNPTHNHTTQHTPQHTPHNPPHTTQPYPQPHTHTGVTDLQRTDTEDPRAKTYALYLADTVIVQPGGSAPEVVTAGAPKSWKAASYVLADEQVCGLCGLCRQWGVE